MMCGVELRDHMNKFNVGANNNGSSLFGDEEERKAVKCWRLIIARAMMKKKHGTILLTLKEKELFLKRSQVRARSSEETALSLWRWSIALVVFKNRGRERITNFLQNSSNKNIVQEEDVVAAIVRKGKRGLQVIDDLVDQPGAKKKLIQLSTHNLKIHDIMRWVWSNRITSLIWGMVLMHSTRIQKEGYDVFINHRGADTKQNIVGLLYDRLVNYNLHPFLDCKCIQPGETLVESINWAIQNCKIGVAIISPRYFSSYFCLLELALLVEANKKLIPIFWDIKPSTLLEVDHIISQFKEVERFKSALLKIKCTVGIVFNSQKGNWPDLLTKATDVIQMSLNQST